MGVFKKVTTLRGKTEIYLFGHKFLSYSNKKDQNKLWREKNKHNETERLNKFDIEKVSVGVGTYGGLNVQTASDGPEKLIIGNYCSIGPDVRFILASEHPYKGVSTYPFKVKFGLQSKEAASKGSIVLEDDVWVGLGVIINSGVHIGRGAVVAAGSVVVKDVEPYSIVGGNPAKHIKYRFDEPIRKKLMKLDFTGLDREKIINNIDTVYKELTCDNVDDVIKIIQG